MFTAGFGTTTGTDSVFGNTIQPSLGFGTAPQPQGGTGFNFGAAVGTVSAQGTPGNLNVSATTEQPFTLSKPPVKRGKRL